MAAQWLRLVKPESGSDSPDSAVFRKFRESGHINCRSRLAAGSAAGDDIQRILSDRSTKKPLTN